MGTDYKVSSTLAGWINNNLDRLLTRYRYEVLNDPWAGVDLESLHMFIIDTPDLSAEAEAAGADLEVQ